MTPEEKETLITQVVSDLFPTTTDLQRHFGCVGRSIPALSIQRKSSVDNATATVSYEIARITKPRDRLEHQALLMQKTFYTAVLLRLETEESIHVVKL